MSHHSRLENAKCVPLDTVSFGICYGCSLQRIRIGFAICFDCSRIKGKGKVLKTITTTAHISIHHRYNPGHQIEIIEANYTIPYAQQPVKNLLGEFYYDAQNKWLKHYLATRMYMVLKPTGGIPMNSNEKPDELMLLCGQLLGYDAITKEFLKPNLTK